MLSLTKKAEYALVAVCHLAHSGSEVVSAREIAELHEVPLPLLMNVLKLLSQAGQVDSVRGARGGYRLAISPHEMSLSAVITAVEGSVHLVKCAGEERRARPACKRSSFCSISKPIIKIHKRMMTFLEDVTVGDIAFDDAYRQDRKSAKLKRVIAE
ncbi:MAG: Rrf2 family transcriptional regulator [Planctomycetota bacterium]